jgi:hypothetical protein
VEYIATLVEGLAEWLAAREIDAVARIRGRMRRGTVADPTAFDRANYIRILEGYVVSRQNSQDAEKLGFPRRAPSRPPLAHS